MHSGHFPEVTSVLFLIPEGTVCPVGCDLGLMRGEQCC